MKVGIIHFMAFPDTIKGEGPIVETLEKICSDDDFQVVELTQIKDADVRKKAIEVVKGADMTVGFGAQPIILINKLNLNSSDAGERQQAVDAVKGGIDEAYEWGAAGLAVLSGPVPDADKVAAEKNLLVDSLKQLCAYSRSKGDMPILLETFDRKPFGKNCLIGPTTDAMDVADAVAAEHPSFGLMFDLSHMPLLEETCDQMLRPPGKHLKHIHIGNCVMKDESHPAYGDGHPRFGADGGENDVDELAEFLTVLKDIGYIGEGKQNIVSFEVKPYGDETPESVIQNAKDTLEAAWQKV
ncbi:MAG: TIM barrel protein [Planctomycetes bacterium]|nr:TIM barrel protein [Planctomycetota bacterium]